MNQEYTEKKYESVSCAKIVPILILLKIFIFLIEIIHKV